MEFDPLARATLRQAADDRIREAGCPRRLDGPSRVGPTAEGRTIVRRSGEEDGRNLSPAWSRPHATSHPAMDRRQLVAGIVIVDVHGTGDLLTRTEKIDRMTAAALDPERGQHMSHGVRRTGKSEAQLRVECQCLERVVRHHAEILAQHPPVAGDHNVLVVSHCQNEAHSDSSIPRPRRRKKIARGSLNTVGLAGWLSSILKPGPIVYIERRCGSVNDVPHLVRMPPLPDDCCGPRRDRSEGHEEGLR